MAAERTFCYRMNYWSKLFVRSVATCSGTPVQLIYHNCHQVYFVLIFSTIFWFFALYSEVFSDIHKKGYNVFQSNTIFFIFDLFNLHIADNFAKNLTF